MLHVGHQDSPEKEGPHHPRGQSGKRKHGAAKEPTRPHTAGEAKCRLVTPSALQGDLPHFEPWQQPQQVGTGITPTEDTEAVRPSGLSKASQLSSGEPQIQAGTRTQALWAVETYRRQSREAFCKGSRRTPETRAHPSPNSQHLPWGLAHCRPQTSRQPPANITPNQFLDLNPPSLPNVPPSHLHAFTCAVPST